MGSGESQHMIKHRELSAGEARDSCRQRQVVHGVIHDDQDSDVSVFSECGTGAECCVSAQGGLNLLNQERDNSREKQMNERVVVECFSSVRNEGYSRCGADGSLNRNVEQHVKTTGGSLN